MLALPPEGFLHLLLPHPTPLLRQIHQHCALVLLSFRQRLFRPTVLALVVGEILVVTLIGASRENLPLSDPGMYGHSSAAILDHTGQPVYLLLEEHPVPPALILKLI